MVEEDGRPISDLSLISTFTFSATEQAHTLPDGTSGVVRDDIQKDQAQQQELSIPETKPQRASHEGIVDLTRYGPPDALARLNQPVPTTVIAMIEDSIETVRAQVDTEAEMRRRQEQTRGKDPQDEQQPRVKDRTIQSIDKGKGIETPHTTPISGPASIIASDQTDTASFYTPSEGGQSPSADAKCETGMDVPTGKDNAPYFRPMPRPKASSTSSIPRRRDLIKSMFRGISDTDARHHVLRRSTGALQFKAKFKHAKQIWQGELQIGSVFLARPSALPVFNVCPRLS